jgi:hypothetical protein
MRTKLFVATSMAAMLAGTMLASAQNPPGSAEQDRGIREDNGRPAVQSPMTDQDQNRGRRSGTVGQGQPGPKGEPEPPGGRYQDEKNNEEIGKPPQGGR